VEGADDDGSGPKIELTSSGLKIESKDRTGISFRGARDRWTVTLGTAPRLQLHATVNAGDARLLLSGASLVELRVDVNAGKATIDLGTVALVGGFELHLNAADAKVNLPNLSVRGSIEANAASVRVCPPAGAGLRVTINDNITASNNFGQRGLVEVSDNVWETTGFGSAAVRLEVDAQVNAGSINVEPEGSCGA
jgi:hypothetical protein